MKNDQSVKFLAIAKNFGLKGVLLGRATIPKSDEDYDEGKKKFKIAELNKTAYTELILSIDDKNINGNISF